MKARTISDFEGLWQLSRRIDHADGTQARFDGQAHWAAAKGGLTYTETGQMLIANAAPMPAQRRYFWRADLSVWFDDGRFFHHVPGGGGSTRHWCDPDLYCGDYAFKDWPAFTVEWTVSGPRKSYVMLSHYKRVSEIDLR